jgi:hypothetical protein
MNSRGFYDSFFSVSLGGFEPPQLTQTNVKERFEIRFEKPAVSTHYAEMGNLLSLNPKIRSFC